MAAYTKKTKTKRPTKRVKLDDDFRNICDSSEPSRCCSTSDESEDDSDTELEVNAWGSQKNPEFLLLKSQDRYLPYNEVKEISRILGIHQLMPNQESLIMDVCGGEFLLKTVADDNLQAQIQNNLRYKKVKSLIKKAFCGLTASENGWVAPEKIFDIDDDNDDDSNKYNDKDDDNNDDKGDDNYSDYDIRKTKRILSGYTITLINPVAMTNSFGTISLQNVLNLCKDVLIDLKIPMVDTVSVYQVTPEGRVLYQEVDDPKEEINDPKEACDQDHRILFGLQSARKSMQKTHETIPDVVLELGVKGDTDRYHVLFVGNVKNMHEARKSPAQCMLQTWRQTLAGLKSLDVAYGILYEPNEITLFQLRKEAVRGKKVKSLNTYVKKFILKPHKLRGNTLFEVSGLIEFIYHVCCILAANLLNESKAISPKTLPVPVPSR